ncbi:MAG: TraM recognition domain-containing protein [Clostridia bacterium]|nr:TraM recognition domain-containing protein [Clostridia bacterium]
MNKMIYSTGSSGIIYKNLGITHVSPDIESTKNMCDVAKNFNIPVNLIDPNDQNSPGLNPFIYDEPSLTAVAISTVIRGMYKTNHTDDEETYRENSAAQAVENLSILLKVMYPRLHNGDLPNLEDMLKMLNDFDLVEDMCKKMEEIPELAEEYAIQIGYFKKNFYSGSNVRQETERFVQSATTQLDSLLRIASVRNILCNRVNNINFDDTLRNGEVTLVCTRRGDLGATAHLAFGLFFILLMQFSVLRRPGNENTRIPHFLYIDDFPEYVGPSTEALYTIYRKYHVGTILSTQNLTQLGLNGQSKYRDTILANSTTKLVFGGITREESEIWEKEFGDHREWKFTATYNTSKIQYDEKFGNPVWDWKANIKSGKLQALKFKDCAYIMKDLKGKNNYGDGKVDFLEAKYKEPHSIKKYDFSRFTNGISEDKIIDKKKKIDLTKTDYNIDSNGDVDPIKTDNTDSDYLFNNDDAIIFDLKRGNSN